MAEHHVVDEALRQRAERQIALAKATGARAHASPDYRVIFVERPDGTRETVRLTPPPH
jgi:hypothetical protein